MKYTVALLIFFISFLAYAQDPKLDSLHRLVLENKASNDMKSYTNTLLRLSAQHFNNDFDSSLHYANKAKELSIQHGYDSLLGASYYLLSSSWSSKGQFDSSIAYCFRGLPLAEKNENISLLIDLYNNLGIDFYYKDDFDEAKKKFEKVVAFAEEAKDLSRKGHGLNNIGMIVGMKGQYYEEIEYYRQAESIFREMGFWAGVANAELNIGTAYTTLDVYDSAEYYLFKALDRYKNLDNQVSVCQLMTSLIELYARSEKFEEAIFYAGKAIDIANEKRLDLDKKHIYKILHGVYASMNNYSKAYEVMTKYMVLNNEIFNAEKEEQISKLKIQYETIEKEREIKQARIELENKSRFQILLIAFIVTVCVLGSFAFVLLVQRFRLNRTLLQKEISTLRNNISALTLVDGKISDNIEKINKDLYKPLSQREVEILECALTDSTNREIAEKLFVSVNTVKYHLKNIYDKLGVSSRKEINELLAKV